MTKRKKTVVVGYPVEHSLSPTIHNYWINKGNIQAATYEKIKIKPNDFEKEIDNLIALGYYGLNVTVPLKELAYLKCDELSEAARKTKAVNTLIFKDGKVYGTNTDPIGFESSLAAKTVEKNINKKSCLVLGAGGSSRAVIHALDKMSANISVFNRTAEKAAKLCEDLEINAKLLDAEDMKKHITSFDLIVNTTSLGLLPGEKNNLIDFSLLKTGAFVYDLIYKPKLSSFLKQAEIKGFDFQNGLKMLIGQAAASFYIWHGIAPSNNNELESLLEKF